MHCLGWWLRGQPRVRGETRALLPTQRRMVAVGVSRRKRRRLRGSPRAALRKEYDKRTPGLFKAQWCGDGFVGLCSKTYYTDKYNTKGLSKLHNEIDKETFLAVLTDRRNGHWTNRGFWVMRSTLFTYIAALFLRKRVVLDDGIRTMILDV